MNEKQIINIVETLQTKDLTVMQNAALKKVIAFLKQYSNLFKGYIEHHP